MARTEDGADRPGQGAPVEAVVDRNEASALADLQMHWDEAYVIGFDGDVWSARFRRSTDLLCARTSSDLRELIRADYVHRQRPQRPALPARSAHPAGDDAEEAGDGSGTAEQAADAPTRTAAVPAGTDFAAIRGERMST